MSGSDAKQGHSKGWEAHAQTILIAITTAGILALVSQGWQMSQNQAAQAEALAEIKSKLERMDSRFAEFPTRTEAETRWRGIESRLDEHGRRIERIEDKR